MADRRSVILKWVFGDEAVSSKRVVFVELVPVLVVVVVVVRARATLNRDVGLI